VFLAALKLHAAFVAANARTVRENLRILMDVLRGNAPAEAPSAVVQAAWQSLFLVIPVISTTFASTSRLFAHLGREALGWLLIDEAGQATPQAAVGAIWRARRVVAVGDPLQIEPVFSTMFTTQQALRRHFDVAETWLPAWTSVQALADRVTPVGTWLPGPDKNPVWVGAPLRVHRRCDEPMFSLVNRIAYDGMMIQATMPRPDPLTVADSTWIDVIAVEADGHWLPDEGHAARDLVDYLLTQGVTGADILAISPFRRASDGLSSVLRPYDNVLAGTVHVAQGKERDVVLLVLGGNPAKPGARAWAARRPNLINVAVSRAKQRLYVIGNHAAWSTQPHFDQLARTLPARPWRPRPRS
jgi:AAA domain